MNNAIQHITVAICTSNRARMLKDALNSLVGLHTASEFTYDIVVVDDGSTDDTPAVVHAIMTSSDAEIRYFRHDVNRGIAAARNTCVREARGEWLAFFDDDEIADHNWLSNLVTTGRTSGADCVGGPYLVRLPG